MGTVRRKIFSTGIKIFDLLLMIGAFGVATLWLVSRHAALPLGEYLAMRVKLGNLLIFCAFLFVWYTTFSVFGLYESKRLSSRWIVSLEILKASSLATLILFLISQSLHVRMVTLGFTLRFWLVVSLATIASRLSMRSMLAFLRVHGRNTRKMLILGSNARAIEFAENVKARPELGYVIIGFADRKWEGAEECVKAGFTMACDLDDLPAFLRHRIVDDVVVALPVRSLHAEASRIVALCEELGIVLRLLPSIFDLKESRTKAEKFEGDYLITHHIEMEWPVLVKRILDFTLSLMLSILLLPVFAIVAILVKLTSRGPVFFVQQRLGLNKRMFQIYKFRTMVVDAEKKLKEVEHLNEVSGPVFKIKNDPRLTPLGRFLRKTSIDELPQLFNVLKGDMSLVGPRPLQVRDYELFNQICKDWQRRRFSVRPGITCLWQVNGRSSVQFEKWMELDLQYIRRWSLWLDLQILIKTIPAVLKGSGAA